MTIIVDVKENSGARQRIADRFALIVVGMHRSGTSALAGAFNLIGFATPPDLLLPGPENPKGFFESETIVAFNEGLLRRLGSRWDDPAPLPDDWAASPIARQATEDLVALLEAQVTGAQPFVFKDPRICRLLPVWVAALEQAGIAARYVLPFRSPLEVAASLRARNDFGRAHGMLLWLEYALAAERLSRGRSRSIIAYDGFLDDWRGGFEKIGADLGIQWPVPPMRRERELDDFLSQELRHNRAAALKLESRDPIEALCAEAFQIFATLEGGSDDHAVARLDELRERQRSAFAILGRVVSDDQGRVGKLLQQIEDERRSFIARQQELHDAVVQKQSDIEARESVIASLHEQIAERERVLASLNQAVAERDGVVQSFHAAVAERDEVVGSLHKAVAERDQVVRSLTEAVAERDAVLASLHAAIADRDDAIRSRDTSIAEQIAGNQVRDAIIAKREGELRARDATIGLRDQTLHVRDNMILELERQVAAHERAESELAAAMQSERQHLEAARASAEHRLAAIEQSTLWRATGVIRGSLARLPVGVRNTVRRSAKGLWWLATPHRTAQRLAFLRARSQQPQEVINPSPNPEASALLDLSMAHATPAAVAVPTLRMEPIDVIVCVHNGLDFVKDCLESVLRNTLPPYNLIIVDDGSGIETRDYLRRFADANRATLKRNETAGGYTLAANRGLKASSAPWVVLLNSDTIVTEGWLDRMWRHGAADPAVGAIGPLSNTASWQSVPDILIDGDWADNPYPPGFDPEGLASIARTWELGSLQMPFLNGFCYMISRRALDRIGPFDEKTFGAGYGEENDYSIRLRKAGMKLIVATDSYVHHAQSKSYSTERRRGLARRADEALANKHDPHLHIYPQAVYCRDGLVFASLRARIAAGIVREQLISEGKQRFEGLSVAFILPVTEPGGGANVVLSEARAMVDMGVNVTILNFDSFQAAFDTYGRPQGLQFRTFRDEAEMKAFLQEPSLPFDAVIATLYKSVFWLPAGRDGPVAIRGYYVQDFEPKFFAQDDMEHQVALDSYKQPSLRMFTKTAWNQKAVADSGGKIPALIGCSLEYQAFAPSEVKSLKDGNAPVVIVAMVRPSTPRRAARRTVDILSAVAARYGHAVRIKTFGARTSELAELDLHRPAFDEMGVLPHAALADLLAEADIFVDFSDYQAMGLTLLEAMASGCAVVGPAAGGATAFLDHGHNGLVVDSTDVDDCVLSVSKLVDDSQMRKSMQRQALRDVSAHLPERAALNILAALTRRD